jgi:iron complex transport system substrate-binding protein
MGKRCAAMSWLLLAGAALAQASVSDDRGAALSFAAPPQRIVSLVPSLTEAVCTLGACARLVGTDRFSNWPAAVRALPKLGGLEDPQIEGVIALKPDLVLVSRSARVIDRLEGLGLKLLVFDSDSHADVRRSLQVLGQVLGDAAAGDRLWADIERRVADAAARVPLSLRGKTVYFEVGSGPYAAGASSFIGQTLARLGLVNIVPAAMGPFPLLNPEFVVRARPDVVMAPAHEVAAMPARPGWAGIAALHGRSCGFEPGRYELLVRPGPRLGEAAEVLAGCLQSVAPGAAVRAVER